MLCKTQQILLFMICDVAVSIFSAALFLNSITGCRLALELTKLIVILFQVPK